MFAQTRRDHDTTKIHTETLSHVDNSEIACVLSVVSEELIFE